MSCYDHYYQSYHNRLSCEEDDREDLSPLIYMRKHGSVIVHGIGVGENFGYLCE